MPKIQKDEVFSKFQSFGRNSSHFVWFLSKLEFFECSNGWIFAFAHTEKATLFALEPLVPSKEGSGDAPEYSATEFEQAWREIESELKPQVSLFISIYDSFNAVLREAGFQTLQVGREPYVNLENCVPTGKSGKSVRAARNQALRAGVTVLEYSAAALAADPALVPEMKKILRQWQSRNLLDLGGFLNAVDPFEKAEVRRYFLATSVGGRLEAFLVATPIPGKNSYFLEDMVIRPGASRGAGELLTLEAMVALAESKAEKASLGVVSMTSIEASSANGLSPLTQMLLVTVPKYLSKLYNVDGLEMFRRRFKPSKWENVHLALKNSPRSGIGDTRAWLLALITMAGLFQPRLNFSFDWLARTILKPIVKNPISNSVAAIFTLSFFLINKGGSLPEWALRDFSFSGDAPLISWPFRTIVSDIIFFDATHYLLSLVSVVVLLRWMEKIHKPGFVATVLIATSFFDDFINQAFLIWPYKYFHPEVFQKLVSIEDVGPSLWAAAFLGIQLCSLRRNREVLFALMTLISVLGFAFNSSHLPHLILNLNHSLFLGLGFIAGKLRFEYEREQSRKVARQKPPVAKSVLAPTRGKTITEAAKEAA